MTLNNFIKTWLTVFVLCVCSVALLNRLIDPYGLWNAPRKDSFNKLKPASGTRSRLVKPHQLKTFNASTLILGNSRPEMGIDPTSKCWPESFDPIYNQAIPGVDLYQQFRLLQHAASFHKPDQIIVAVDFNDFISGEPINKSIWPPKNDVEKLSVGLDGEVNSKYLFSILSDQLKVTFSLDTFFSSIFTMFSQRDKFSSNQTMAGFNTANDYKKIIETEGQEILFLQKNISMIERMDRPMYLLNEDDWSQSFETYRRFLKYNEAENINVTVVINPYHSDYLEVIRQAGHWNLFIAWKEKIAQISLDFKYVSLWDFSLVNELTSEQPPEKGNIHKKINWFWEPAHYNSKYGDLMLDAIFQSNCVADKNGSTYGIKVISISNYRNRLNKEEHLLILSGAVSRISELFIERLPL